MTWRRGIYRIACHPAYAARDHRDGWLSDDGLWGACRDYGDGWVLTHLPTGCSVFHPSTLRECKAFAEEASRRCRVRVGRFGVSPSRRSKLVRTLHAVAREMNEEPVQGVA